MSRRGESSDGQAFNVYRLGLFLLVALVSIGLWRTPVLYPLKIFVVFIHETGHALTAVLTGGDVVAMVVTPWESGYLEYRGGMPLLVASAGYLGSAAFGGVMLFLSGRERWASTIFSGLALLFGGVTLSFVRNGFGLIFGLLTTAVFAGLAWKRFPGAHYIIDVLAVMSTLYALYDLSDFLFIGAETDAVILARMTPLPAFVWAILWSAVSVGVVCVAGAWALRRR
jgi:hypothetical protein